MEFGINRGFAKLPEYLLFVNGGSVVVVTKSQCIMPICLLTRKSPELRPKVRNPVVIPRPEPPVVVLPDGRDDDADHDVDGAEDGDRRTVVHAALPEVVILATRGGDDELHCLSCAIIKSCKDHLLRDVHMHIVWLS